MKASRLRRTNAVARRLQRVKRIETSLAEKRARRGDRRTADAPRTLPAAPAPATAIANPCSRQQGSTSRAWVSIVEGPE